MTRDLHDALARTADRLPELEARYRAAYTEWDREIGPASPRPGRRSQPASRPPAGEDLGLRALLVTAVRHLADAHLEADLAHPWPVEWQPSGLLGHRDRAAVDCVTLHTDDDEVIVCRVVPAWTPSPHNSHPLHPEVVVHAARQLRAMLGAAAGRPLRHDAAWHASRAVRHVSWSLDAVQRAAPDPPRQQIKRCGWCALAPVKADDRCSACYEYRRTHDGRERPPHLLSRGA